MKGRHGIIGAVAIGAILVLIGCSKDPAPAGQAPAAGSAQGGAAAGAQGSGPGQGASPAAPGNGQAGQGNGQAGQGFGQGGPSGGGAARAGGRRFAVIPVQATMIQIGPLVTDNNTAGTIVPVTQSQVASQVAGVVSRTLHVAGDWVNSGDVVVQLDDSQLQLALQNAQAALQNAKINLAMGQQTSNESNPRLMSQLQSAQTAQAAAQKNYNSQKALYDLGGISASALDNAQSQLQAAQANVQAAQLALDQNNAAGTQTLAQLQLAVDQATVQLGMAQLNLKNAAIRAPFAGQIAAINVTPGGYVSQNTATFLLVSAARQINFSMPPVDAPNFPIGSIISFVYNGKTYPVRIVQQPSAPINGVVPMVAAAPPGLTAAYGTVGTVVYRETIATGALLPVSALQTRANINFVDLIVNNKTAEQPVTILAQSGDTAVVSGIDGGAQVVLNAPPGLVAGSSVQPVLAQTPASNGGQGAGAQSGQRTYGQAGGSRAAGGAAQGSASRGGASGQGGQ